MNMVSVIIPIYNVIQYLDTCVSSAVNQTYTNIEIILVDDGSTDGSEILCDRWRGRDERIKVIHKKNGGLSDARNAGLDVATGDYIYFLDGDDHISETLLEKTMPYFDDGADLVSFQYLKEYPDGTSSASHFEVSVYTINNEKERFQFVTTELLRYKLGWEAWGRVYRRDIIEKNQIRFADNRKIFAEDIYFSMCYSVYISKAVVIPDILYFYRQSENSIMAQQNDVLNAGRMNELCKELYAYYSTNRVNKLLIEHFSVIYHLILDNVLSRYQRGHSCSVFQMRELLIRDVEDFGFLQMQYNRIQTERENLYPVYKNARLLEYVINVDYYYAQGNKLLFRIRNKCAAVASRIFDLNGLYGCSVKNEIQNFSRTKKKCYLIGTEDFGNIGDHAIAEAQIAFIKKHFADYQIMEITARDFSSKARYLKEYIKKDDVFFLTGGGNFGDEYPFSQDIKDMVCSEWKDNLKVVFPQTVYFSDTPKGEEQLNRAKTIYAGKNILIFTREKKSYESVQSWFSCECFCVPDIVLSLDAVQYDSIERNGVLLCMRSDKEKVVNETEQELLLNAVKVAEKPYHYTDLQLDSNINKKSRRFFIEEKWKLFCSAELVITDRLHGMVFAALTGTPCVVFSNYNHKVKGTYDWISYLPYIRYVETVEEAEAAIPELLKMKNCIFDNTPLLPHFEKLAEVVKDRCQR